uniref:Uncharacterized protein n=1 Tax=Caenorhabditis tropicalis TaxID=1561998 RepID=A0A1I7TIG2_9PELO
MTGVTLSNSHVQQWNCENNTKKNNLCEVCFKPFNLANIDMHLEAGCAAEIYNRYNITPIQATPTEKKIKRVKKNQNTKKINRNPKSGRKTEKTTQ